MTSINTSKVPLSKPVVGQNIALHAVSAYRASTYLVRPDITVMVNYLSTYLVRPDITVMVNYLSTYLVSAFLAHSTSFSPNFSKS